MKYIITWRWSHETTSRTDGIEASNAERASSTLKKNVLTEYAGSRSDIVIIEAARA